MPKKTLKNQAKQDTQPIATVNERYMVTKEEAQESLDANLPPADVDKIQIKSPQTDSQQELDFIDQYINLKETRSKYASIQDRRLVFARIDKDDNETLRDVIELLEKTRWPMTQAFYIVIQQWFYLNKSGLFSYFMRLERDKKLDSDKIEDLIFIRDGLKDIVPEFLKFASRTMAGTKTRPNR